MNWFSTLIDACLLVLAISLGLTVYRLIKGPSVPDRIMSLDLTAVLIVANIGVLCIKFQDAHYLDAAVVLSVITFLGTVSFARYLERRAREPR